MNQREAPDQPGGRDNRRRRSPGQDDRNNKPREDWSFFNGLPDKLPEDIGEMKALSEKVGGFIEENKDKASKPYLKKLNYYKKYTDDAIAEKEGSSTAGDGESDPDLDPNPAGEADPNSEENSENPTPDDDENPNPDPSIGFVPEPVVDGITKKNNPTYVFSKEDERDLVSKGELFARQLFEGFGIRFNLKTVDSISFFINGVAMGVYESKVARIDEKIRKAEREGIGKSTIALRQKREKASGKALDFHNKITSVARILSKEIGSYLDPLEEDLAFLEPREKPLRTELEERQGEVADLTRRLDEIRKKENISEEYRIKAAEIEKKLAGETVLLETIRKKAQKNSNRLNAAKTMAGVWRGYKAKAEKASGIKFDSFKEKPDTSSPENTQELREKEIDSWSDYLDKWNEDFYDTYFVPKDDFESKFGYKLKKQDKKIKSTEIGAMIYEYLGSKGLINALEKSGREARFLKDFDDFNKKYFQKNDKPE